MGWTLQTQHAGRHNYRPQAGPSWFQAVDLSHHVDVLRPISHPPHGVQVTCLHMHDGGAPPTSAQPSPLLSSPLPCLRLCSAPHPRPSPPTVSFLLFLPLPHLPSLQPSCVLSLHHGCLGLFCAAAAPLSPLNLFSFSVQMCRHAKAGWEGQVTYCFMSLPRPLGCAEGELSLGLARSPCRPSPTSSVLRGCSSRGQMGPWPLQ